MAMLTTITTRDGACPTHVFRPSGSGPWPAVLIYMDAPAIRPAMIAVAERLADMGYLAVLPDLYYRTGPYTALTEMPEAERRALQQKFRAEATTERIMADTRAFLDWIKAQPDVKPGKIGTTGYCMGGFLSLTAAGTYPDEIEAAASFHGGRLATEEPDSPHKLAPKMKAHVYVAGATNDSAFPDDQKARLEKALTDAHVDHTVVTYPASHGWVFSDLPVYDKAQSERHFDAMQSFFGAALG